MNIAYMNGDNEPVHASPVQSHRLRQVHEVFFSLNISLGIVLGIEFRPYDIFLPIFRLEEFLSHQFGLRGSGTSAYLAFFLCVVLLTALPFLLLRCFRRTSVGEYILIYIAGFTALGVTPACWFYLKRPYPSRWYPAEVVVYFALAILYLLQKWPLSGSASILIASLHYGFWFLRFWEYAQNPIELLMPVVGFCACLAWGIYVPIGRARLLQASPSANASTF
jgi:hypothetical protein